MTENPLRATVSQRGVMFGPHGEILVVRRASDGGWELPGGRLGAYEEAVDGLRREVEEETGLVPDVTGAVHAVSWRNDDDNGRFAVYYSCSVDERTVTLSHEHSDHAWLPADVAVEWLSDPQGNAVERALDDDPAPGL